MGDKKVVAKFVHCSIEDFSQMKNIGTSKKRLNN
jgi:hypothetical protein